MLEGPKDTAAEEHLVCIHGMAFHCFLVSPSQGLHSIVGITYIYVSIILTCLRIQYLFPGSMILRVSLVRGGKLVLYATFAS